MEGKCWDHRQLAKADGTRAVGGGGSLVEDWGASISHSVTPVHIALLCISMCARMLFYCGRLCWIKCVLC